MYAGMKVNWHEILSSGTTNVTAADESIPLFLCAFSSDKGTEAITTLTYDDFRAMYGNSADYFKYGQPLIQTHAILSAGGRVLGKRLVAEDATLANIVITAEITVTGTDPDKVVTVKYAAKTIAGAKTYAEVVKQAAAIETASEFPLLVICDNGRGASNKSVKIVPNYNVSRSLSFCLYDLYDIEGTSSIESTRFSMYPNGITYSSSNRSTALIKNSTTQFQTSYCDTGVANFLAKLAEETGYTVDELYSVDLLFAKDVKGEALSAWSVDDTGIDLSATYGIPLQSGTNGAFGDAPFAGETASTDWTTQAVAFFDGTFSEEIYDLDQYKIDFCVDANYPMDVKHAIAELVSYRQDFYYFRDLSLDISSINDIQQIVSDLDWERSPFIGDYSSVYDILDSKSKKQITVTMTHGLAPLLVTHFTNNAAAPIAGEFNNFIITEAVEGSLRFVPRVTPKVDQKTILDELKVNYLNYSSDNNLTIFSTYTSQDHWGPLSYSSNVIITQKAVKAIRRYTPKIRFMLTDNSDFTEYKSLIENNVLTNYTNYFKSIELVYSADADETAAKTFNASVRCYYKDFPQGEIFNVYAIEGSPETNPMGNTVTNS